MKKVSELEGAELDYWVAKALGYECFYDGIACQVAAKHKTEPFVIDDEAFVFDPSSNWAIGGPIIEARLIELRTYYSSHKGKSCTLWTCKASGASESDHPQPLVTAMRLVVRREFGDEVDG